MARMPFRFRPILTLALCAWVGSSVALSGAASGLPVDNPVRDVKDRVDDALDRGRRRANDAVDRVRDDVDRVSRDAQGAVAQVVGSPSGAVAGAVESKVGSPSRERSSKRDRGSGEAGRRAGGSSSRSEAEAGDVDELAQGGNEVAPGSGQQGAGISVPIPPQGGENEGLGFTGGSVLRALALALALAFTGAYLLAVDLRRMGLARAAATVG
jgi:hypothetical protein